MATLVMGTKNYVQRSTGPLRSIALGRCYPSSIPNASQIYVKRLEFDEWIKMYFSYFYAYYCHDPKKLCKTGDYVLIEPLASPLTRDITHRVLQVIYPCGDVTDPITGKKCVGGEYRDEMEWKDQLWGKNPRAFNYDKAPPRGWQEGKLDWSHKPGYKRWHEFPNKDQTESTY